MKRQSCRESFWVLLLAGAQRSDVNALNEGSVQCDVEFLQGLQHSDQGIDECVVLDQRHVLIHVRSDGAVGQQGYPVVQEVISGSQAHQHLKFAVLANVPGRVVDCSDKAAEIAGPCVPVFFWNYVILL